MDMLAARFSKLASLRIQWWWCGLAPLYVMLIVEIVYDLNATIGLYLDDSGDVPAWYDVTAERMSCANCISSHRARAARKAMRIVARLSSHRTATQSPYAESNSSARFHALRCE